jgi:hypothetical protein
MGRSITKVKVYDMPSFCVFFTFSSGINEVMKVPVGTCDSILKHVETVTKKGGLKIIKYRDNPYHWESCEPSKDLDNLTVSNLVRNHNSWVERLYINMNLWSKTSPKESEDMTPEFMKSIWYGLSMLRLPICRWSGDFYKEEMQRIFDVMRGEFDIGIDWGETPLTPKQAMGVIHLFEVYLDENDVRLELPDGWTDRLLDADEYEWCDKCGAIPIDQ